MVKIYRFPVGRRAKDGVRELHLEKTFTSYREAVGYATTECTIMNIADARHCYKWNAMFVEHENETSNAI